MFHPTFMRHFQIYANTKEDQLEGVIDSFTDESDLSIGASYVCQILHICISRAVICTPRPAFEISIFKV